MDREIVLLCMTAASIGFFHTLIGPDHYLPFIAMSKARNWSQRRTLLLTIGCGIGHVLSSIVIGAVGIILGIGVSHLEPIESSRGELAAWLLLTFGFLYMVWGLKRAFAKHRHEHSHAHADGTFHVHHHGHERAEHQHVHATERKSITPWVLFTIFVLGPCEPLIPILMYPAAIRSTWGLVAVTSVFAVTTVVTMTVLVALAYRGLEFLPYQKLERFTHALAGGILFLTGFSVVFLGL